MLDHLLRRDNALVQVFLDVLEISDQKHVVDYILERHGRDSCNTDNEVPLQQRSGCRNAAFQPGLAQDTACGGQQLNPSIDDTGRKLVIREQVFVDSSSESDGIYTSGHGSLHVNMLDSNVDMDCLPAQDGSTSDSETACKVIDSSPLPGQVASMSGTVKDVCCGHSLHDNNSIASETACKTIGSSPPPGQAVSTSGAIEKVDLASGLDFMATERSPASGQGLKVGEIELREYQKELSRPGIAGRNLIICAPTGCGKTYTAGYICQQRRMQAQKDRRRFKAMFIVCIRNLITQQTDALKLIIGNDVVRGADDKLTLKTLSDYSDVVVATAQVSYSKLILLCCVAWSSLNLITFY